MSFHLVQVLAVFEPNEHLEASGIAAVLADETIDEWAVALGPDAARTIGKRLIELADSHEREHPPQLA